MLRVLLAYRCSDEGKDNPFERVLPVGVGYIHAYLRTRGVPAVVANFSTMGPAKVKGILLAEKPGIVGISCFTFNRRASLALARLVRRTLPRATIVLGGPHATHAAVSLMKEHPEIDFCVSGEGELTLERLARTIFEGGDPSAIRGLFLRRNGEIVPTGAAEPIRDLDALPFPALYPEGHGVDPRAQFPYIVTSRGCPAACSFCSSPGFWGRTTRFRSAANILDELVLLRNRFGILYVSFRDDIFALNKRRVLELCRGMVERRLGLLWDCQTRVNAIDEERLIWMKRAGATTVQYGIESGSQAILDRLQKGQRIEQVDRAAAMTRRVGLTLSIYLITGVQGETDADLRATEAMVMRIRPHDGIVTPLAVFPGTDLWTEYRSGRSLDDSFWEGVGHDGIYARPDRFTEGAQLRLSNALDRAGRRGGYTRAEFAAHRAVARDCYVTDLMEGESLERVGRPAAAGRIYGALAAREPWNPWAPMRLGRLALAGGNREEAARQFARAIELVPASAEAAALLASATVSRPRRGGRPGPATPSRRTLGPSRRPARGFQAWPPPRTRETHERD